MRVKGLGFRVQGPCLSSHGLKYRADPLCITHTPQTLFKALATTSSLIPKPRRHDGAGFGACSLVRCLLDAAGPLAGSALLRAAPSAAWELPAGLAMSEISYKGPAARPFVIVG